MGFADPAVALQIVLLAAGIAAAIALFVAPLGRRLGSVVGLGTVLLMSVAGIAFQTRQAGQSASIAALEAELPGRARRASQALSGRGSPATSPAASAPLSPSTGTATPDLLADYVSSDRCQSCHPGNYASWHASYHRTMTQPARPPAVIGRFEGQTLAAKGRRYRLERRGDEYWVEMADPDWEADLIARGVSPDTVPDEQAPRLWKRVVMTTGSHHMQTYWVASARDGRLFNFPWLWLVADQRWIPREDGFIRPPDGPRTFDVWHDSCIECHAVAGEKEQAPLTGWNPRAAELGIACEACHGPAQEHVRVNRDPLRRYRLRASGEADPTIVNPARLDAKASSQVCGYCHGINMWKPEPLQAGQRFHPGDDLRETRVVLRASAAAAHSTDLLEKRDWPRLVNLLERSLQSNPTLLEERFWPDGMVRVSGREHNGMIESACFEGGELSCLSCHSMHTSADLDDQLARDKQQDAACLQCHPRYAENVEAHTHHPVDSEGSRCQNCHMPHTVYGLLKSIRSHWIDSPNATTARDTGRSTACNLCHLDRSLGWSADRLEAWYGQPRPSLTTDQERVGEGIRMALTGDAQQRAMTAWHMGWAEAKRASGSDWMGHYLGHLLDDPYPAVRYIAGHSLGRLSPERPFVYDFLAEPRERARESRAGAACRSRRRDRDRA
jgi:predicted CXXCH cytochrome family protein